MKNELEKLLTTLMPFGKYKGRPLIDLPEPYVVWFHVCQKVRHTFWYKPKS